MRSHDFRSILRVPRGGFAVLFLAFGLLVATSPARGATIGFAGLTTGNTYTEAGFQLTTDSSFLPSQSGNPPPGMFVGATTQRNVLRLETGGAFDVFSVDLTEQNESNGIQTVEFTGQLASGATVTQIFVTDGPWGYQTFAFSEQFRALASLEWDQLEPECFLNYDNLVALPSPVATQPIHWGRVKSLYAR